MNRHEILKSILESGIVAVIRMSDPKKVQHVVDALRLGGITCIEITMTVPGAVGIIQELADDPRGCVIGAGTVTEGVTAHAVIDAGTKFVVSPIFNPQILGICREREIVCIPGCFSPTEIHTAWTAGADIIKIFPARNLGPSYLKDLLGPFPRVKFMPTGGVTIENASAWIAAGAACVGIGGELLDKKAIEEGRFEVLTEKAMRLVDNCRSIKRGS